MTAFEPGTQRLVLALSALAGYIDAIGFLTLDGLFVAFMSGNSTQMSVALTQSNPHAVVAAALIALFVLGVVLGSTAGHLTGTSRRPAVIALVTTLLVIAALIGDLGSMHGAIAVLTVSMGAVNAVFERNGEVHIGVTYMTGALVKLGQRIAAIPFGGEPLAWLPHLKLWISLIVGAFIGAIVFPHLRLNALWPAAAMGVVLTLAARWLDRRETQAPQQGGDGNSHPVPQRER